VPSNFVRRGLAAALGACAALVAVGVTAQAQPAPNCTAADLAGIATGVAAGTSTYLFTHPPVNDFFTSLQGKTPEEKETAVNTYMDANPQVEADLQGIRRPLVDFRSRCHHA
jgi:heme-binding protein